MTLSLAVLAASVAILPSDRMGMADRLFDRGQYAEAKNEYLALKGTPGIPEDELLYRIAETTRAAGDAKSARSIYGELVSKFPASRHANRARLMRALAGTEAEQKAELPALDADGVPDPIRAAALYHLGSLTANADMLMRSVRTEPKGPYAVAARFRRAAVLASSSDPKTRRSAVAEFNELSFMKDRGRADEALYMAVRCSYTDSRFSESASLAQRYLKQYPDGAYAANVRVIAAWSLYETGKWALAESFCGDIRSDDFDYLRAACALASGDNVKAKSLFEKYLGDNPQGRYRKNAELPLARIDFSEASAGADKSLMVEAARRSAKLSGSSGDRLRLAWALENAGRADESRTEYSAIARDFPMSPDGAEALYRRAMADARSGRWSEAELALAEALSGSLREERRALALYWRGISAKKLAHDEEGLKFLAEALEAGLPLDETREAKLFLADDAFKRGREADAKKAYAALVREGATARMSAARIRNVGRFLLSARGGDAMPEEALVCAEALVAQKGDAAEWHQAGWALKGAAEEAQGAFTSAIDSYRNAMSANLKAHTEDLPSAAFALGVLEMKAGEFDKADATLREAVAFYEKDNAGRMRTYLALAKNSLAWGKADEAAKYATIVTTLFDDADAAKEANEVIAKSKEANK